MMRSLLEAYLRRVELDDVGIALRLFPFTRQSDIMEQPRMVVLDPQMCFGRPSISGTGISTEIIVERYKAGESVDDLVVDYRLEREAVEEAIRCELPARAA